MHVDSATQGALNDLAGTTDLARTAKANAARTGVDAGSAAGVLIELARTGWAFGRPDHWQLTGVGRTTQATRGKAASLATNDAWALSAPVCARGFGGGFLTSFA